jgi:hypothetical protein
MENAKVTIYLKILSIPVPRLSCIIMDISNKRKQLPHIWDLANGLICVAVFLFSKIIIVLLILKRVLFHGKLIFIALVTTAF